MNQIKVGDKVKTRRGYQGVVTSIYGDGRVMLDIGGGHVYGCCIQALTKLESEERKTQHPCRFSPDFIDLQCGLCASVRDAGVPDDRKDDQ